MIDFGKWLGEEYRVSDPVSPDQLDPDINQPTQD
jgi:endogenous inhibitor of DNA gyrase (YacG/DUF329 family)